MSEKTKFISVSFCCNDPNNGNFTGRFDAVHIGDDLLHLEGKYHPERGLKIATDFTGGGGGWGASPAKGRIKISRRYFEIHGYTYGFGNWCWDLFMIAPRVAIDLINYLKSFDHFQSQDSEVWFYEKFEESGFVFDRDGEKELALLAEYGYSKP